MEHGNEMDISKPVRYEYILREDGLTIDVWDQGPGFDANIILNKKLNSGDISIRSRGMKMLEAYGFAVTAEPGHVQVKQKVDLSNIFAVGGKKMDIKLIEDRVFVRLNTNLTAPNIRAMAEALKQTIEESHSFEVLEMDLNEAKSIDSMGITFLIGLYKTLSPQNKRIRLTGVAQSIQGLFKSMKLNDLFDMD